MFIRHGSTGTSLKAGLALLAATMLLSACTPLDQEIKELSPTTTGSTSVPPSPTAEAVTWKNCTNAVITPGKAETKNWKLVSVVQMTKTPNSTEMGYLLDAPATISITWSKGGSGVSRFNEQISAAIGYPTEGTTGKAASEDEMFGEEMAVGTFIRAAGFKRVEVPVSVSCGETLASEGIVHTWKLQETTLFECGLPETPAERGTLASAARKDFCPNS